MPGVKFVPNPLFLQQFVRQPQAIIVLHRAAEVALTNIEQATPVRSGAYLRSFVQKLGPVETDAAAGTSRIIVGEPRWHIIENGSVKNQPYHPMLKGCEATGLRYERQ